MAATRGRVQAATSGRVVAATRGRVVAATRGRVVVATRGRVVAATRGRVVVATRGRVVGLPGVELSRNTFSLKRRKWKRHNCVVLHTLYKSIDRNGFEMTVQIQPTVPQVLIPSNRF